MTTIAVTSTILLQCNYYDKDKDYILLLLVLVVVLALLLHYTATTTKDSNINKVPEGGGVWILDPICHTWLSL
jgi:hypothetical protein